MSVRELRWHRGKYTTFNEYDIFKGLGNALPEAKYKDMGTPLEDSTTSPAMTDAEDTQPTPVGTPPVDSTTSHAMTDAKDTQPSPVEAPLVDDTTVPAAKSDARIMKDLPAAWGASPARLADLVAPTAIFVDRVAGPPTLACHTIREGQEYLQWIKVHSSQKVAAVGSVPYQSRGPWWCCNCSSKQRERVQCLLEEEWQDLGDVSGSTSSKGSSEPVAWDEEGKGANLKGCSQGSGRLLSAWQPEEAQRGRPLSPWMFLRPVQPHTADGAYDSNGDLHLHGEGSKMGPILLEKLCILVLIDIPVAVTA